MDFRATREQAPQIVRSAGPMAFSRPGMSMTKPPAGMTGRDVLRILRRRKWLIVLSLLISTTVTFVGTLLWRIYAPFYTATAYISVQPPRSAILSGYTSPASTTQLDRLQANVSQMMRSEQVLDSASKKDKLRNTVWFQRNARDILKELYQQISVTPLRGTDFLQVSLTDRASDIKQRAQLADIVNCVAEEGIRYVRENTNAERRRERSTLASQQTSLREEINRIQAELQTSLLEDAADSSGSKFQEKDKEKDTEKEKAEQSESIIIEELRRLAGEVREAEIQKSNSQRRYNEIKDLPEEKVAEQPAVRERIAGDPELARLNAEASAVESAMKFGGIGPGHPNYQASQQRLDGLRKQIEVKRSTVTQMAVRTYIDLVQKDLENQVSQLELIGNDYRDKQEQLKAVQKKMEDRRRQAEARMEERRQKSAQAAGLQGKYEDVGKRILELDLLLSEDQQISIGRPAEIPKDPSHPQWSLMMVLGVMLGLVIGLGLTFLLEFIDTSIKSPTDLLRRVDLPLLGMVPHCDDLEEEITEPRLAFATHPNSLIGEAFRQIRTCLLFSGPTESRRSLLITSPLPGDGRGTVAMNLAASIARGGRKVLVVDANFRQPMVRSLVPQVPEGLSSALVGQASWREMVHEIEPNYRVMAAGPMPPNPAELLGSDAMRQLLDEMIREYDQVIFDGPPCLLVTDPAVLGAMVDGVVIVARAGANTYGVVQRSRDIFARVGAHVLGVVLNGVKVTAGGYFRRNYDAFYAYHEQPQLKAS